MPIGIIGSLIVCTVLYIAVSAVLTGIVPYTKLNVDAPVSFALSFVGQDKIAGFISVGAVIGMVTVILALIYAQVRLSFVMSRDGLLPKSLSRLNKKRQTPFLNTWITGFIGAGIAGFLDLTTLAHLVNMGTLAAFTLVSIAIIILRKKFPDVKSTFRVPFVPVVPLLSALFCIYLSLSLPGITWISFIIWIAVGAVVYFLYGKQHSNLNVKS
jgi:APA family basic amino acid/polyamine antiporter